MSDMKTMRKLKEEYKRLHQFADEIDPQDEWYTRKVLRVNEKLRHLSSKMVDVVGVYRTGEILEDIT